MAHQANLGIKASGEHLLEPISGIVSPPHVASQTKARTLRGTKAQLDQPVKEREGEEGERALKKDRTDKISDI